MIGSSFATSSSQRDEAAPQQGSILPLLEDFLPTSLGPADWPHDGRGRPRWLQLATIDCHLAPWATVISERTAMPRVWMPRRLRRSASKPTRALASPGRCVCAAWRKDFKGMTFKQVEAALWIANDPSRTHSKTVESYVGAGRQLLHAHGVLPWALWDTGGPDRADWWRGRAFLAAVAAWAVLCHADAHGRIDRQFRSTRPTRGDAHKQRQREQRLDDRRAAMLCPAQEVSDSDRRISDYVTVKDALHHAPDWRRTLTRDQLFSQAQWMKRAATEAELVWSPPAEANNGGVGVGASS